MRDRFRSSLLHNTLTFDGRSQSIPRGPFHWSHVANATPRRWRTNRHFDYFVGRHDGYAPCIHFRHVLMLHNELLVVADCVTAAAAPTSDGRDSEHHAAVHWHLDPAWRVALAGEHAQLVAGAAADEPGAGGSVDLHVVGGRLERHHADSEGGLGWHAPAYGRVEPTTTLRVEARGRLPLWIVSVFGLDPSNRVQQVSLTRPDVRHAVDHHAARIRIARESSLDTIVVAEPFDEGLQLRWRAFDTESDARFLLLREQRGELTQLAVADATEVRFDRPDVSDQVFPSPVSDLFMDLAPGQPNRKAS
jgi:hypothetical protein